MSEQTLTKEQAEQFLRTTAAELRSQALGRKTFYSSIRHETYQVTAGSKPGTVRIRTLGGCVC